VIYITAFGAKTVLKAATGGKQKQMTNLKTIAAVLIFGAMMTGPAWSGPDCGSDYRLCLRDNNTVVNVHSVRNIYGDRAYDTNGTIPIPIACQDEARLRGIKNLKPGLLGAFSLAPPGGDFVYTGVARLSDGPLVCIVDLKTGLVKSVAPLSQL